MTAPLVMVVDDDPGLLKLVEITLASAGFAVLLFEDPREALADVEEGLRPDVIVSDISMPAVDGFEFYRRVREHGELRAVPFLFLTAMEDRSYMRRGMTLGADDYLTKPFERHELVAAVRARLKRLEELRHPFQGTLWAQGLGPPAVKRDGQRIDWDSLKALELLFYLLEHGDGVGTFEVAEALWPGKTEGRASSSFHTTLYRLRRNVGGELVESANRRYYLRKEFRIGYDVERYRSAVRKASEVATRQEYDGAISLYRGDFLQGFDSPWIVEQRELLHAEQLSLLQGAAIAALGTGEIELATRYWQSMTEHEPYSEQAWQGLADSWERRGERHMAQEARRRFEEMLR